jgi:hypothetical protein
MNERYNLIYGILSIIFFISIFITSISSKNILEKYNSNYDNFNSLFKQVFLHNNTSSEVKNFSFEDKIYKENNNLHSYLLNSKHIINNNFLPNNKYLKKEYKKSYLYSISNNNIEEKSTLSIELPLFNLLRYFNQKNSYLFREILSKEEFILLSYSVKSLLNIHSSYLKVANTYLQNTNTPDNTFQFIKYSKISDEQRINTSLIIFSIFDKNKEKFINAFEENKLIPFKITSIFIFEVFIVSIILFLIVYFYSLFSLNMQKYTLFHTPTLFYKLTLFIHILFASFIMSIYSLSPSMSIYNDLKLEKTYINNSIISTFNKNIKHLELIKDNSISTSLNEFNNIKEVERFDSYYDKMNQTFFSSNLFNYIKTYLYILYYSSSFMIFSLIIFLIFHKKKLLEMKG